MIQDFMVTRTVVIILVSVALGMVARTGVLAIKAKDKPAIAFSSTIGLFLFSCIILMLFGLDWTPK